MAFHLVREHSTLFFVSKTPSAAQSKCSQIFGLKHYAQLYALLGKNGVFNDDGCIPAMWELGNGLSSASEI